MITLQTIGNYFETRKHRRLASLFGLPENANVLDVSCGDGDMLAILHARIPDATFHGIDISSGKIGWAKSRCPWGTFCIGRAESLPYEPHSFTAVICCMSLHHYHKPKEVFTEIARVLSPDGALYLIDRIPTFRWSQYLSNWDGCPEPYHFEKYYLREDIQTLAASVGLGVTEDKMVSFSFGTRLLVLKKDV